MERKRSKKWLDMNREERRKYFTQDHVDRKEALIEDMVKSKDEVPDGSGLVTLGDLIAYMSQCEDVLENELFSCLTAYEKKLVTMRFIDRLPFRKIANKVNITVSIEGMEYSTTKTSKSSIVHQIDKVKGKLMYQLGQKANNKDKD